MRSFFIPLLALVLTSCANEGTVVRKDSSPMPFYHSLGIEGSYKLALRDSAGAVHSQLVTPEVYQDYAEGDYFNDAQPPAASRTQSADAKDAVAMRTVSTQTLAASRLGHGNRLAGKGAGTRRGNASLAAHKRATSHQLVAASTRKISPAATAPKPAIPVVAAHFSVGVQPSSPIQTTTLSAEIPAAANNPAPAQTVAIASPKPAVQKNPATRMAAAQTSRPSYHVAHTKSVTPAAKVAAAHPTTAPSNHVAFVTQKLATETRPASAPAAHVSAKAKTPVPQSSAKSAKPKQDPKQRKS